MIEDYRELVGQLIAGLSVENHGTAVECATLPDQVRGYGPVKAASIVEYRNQRAALLHRFLNPAAVVQVQEPA